MIDSLNKFVMVKINELVDKVNELKGKDEGDN